MILKHNFFEKFHLLLVLPKCKFLSVHRLSCMACSGTINSENAVFFMGNRTAPVSTLLLLENEANTVT